MSPCEILEWKSCYDLEFSSVIRGHHVYKKSCSPYVGEKLMCKMDNRQEAKENDEYVRRWDVRQKQAVVWSCVDRTFFLALHFFT